MQVDQQLRQQQGPGVTKSQQDPQRAAAQASVQQYLLQELCGVLCVSPKEEVR